MRVRTLVILAVVAAFVAAAWWSLDWATSLAPLSARAATWGPRGLPVAARMPAVIADGPNAYRWRRAGTYTVQLEIHNSASVPVTITAADHTDGAWGGGISGPTLRNATLNFGLVPRAFHAVRIPADRDRAVAFVFHANPRAICSTGVSVIDSLRVHFTALGVFHDTQRIPLGEMAAVMTDRRC